MKNRIKIFVDGKSFTLVGEETEAHMQAVAAYIHEKIAEIRSSAAATRMDTSLAYVLAALNVADDYFKEKERAAELEGRNLGLRTRLEELMDQQDALRAEIKELQEKLKKTDGNSLKKEEISAEVSEEEYPKEIVLIHPAEEVAETIIMPTNQEENHAREKDEAEVPQNNDGSKELFEEEYPKEIVLTNVKEEIGEEIAAPLAYGENAAEEKEQVIINQASNATKNAAVQRPQQRKSKRGRSRKR